MNWSARMLKALVLGVSLIAAMTQAQPQAAGWPTKPIRIVNPFPPGAPGDTLARLLVPDLQASLGQTVIVDNKPGAGGNIGALEVARATDGHTFLLGPDSIVTINPHLYKQFSRQLEEKLVPLTQLSDSMLMLVCHKNAGIASMKDFVAAAKAKPFNYASGGIGSPAHLTMELLDSQLGIKLTHVSYRGPGPALQDVTAGVVPCGFLASTTAGPLVRSGQLVALGVSSATRASGSPDVPTIAEAGVPGFEASFFQTIFVPSGTPPEVAAKLRQAFVDALKNPQTRTRMLALDLLPMGSTPQETKARSRIDSERWGQVIDRLGIQLD